MHTLDWNHLQFLLAVANHGSLARAATALGTHHTTVLRRIGVFERQLGVRLCERLSTGYVLTAAGEELTRAARSVDETVSEVERRISGQDLRLTGTVRITTTDTLALSLLPGILGRFVAAHPHVRLELGTGNAILSLTRRDADVAVRPTSQPPEHLVGRKVASVAFAPYAAPSYMQDTGKRALNLHTWLAPDDGLRHTVVARWMAKNVPKARIALRADTLTALAQAATAGLGAVVLPCYLGDTTQGLRRLTGPLRDAQTELWVLTHRDLRGAARIRVVTGFLCAALAAHAPLFAGVAALSPRASARSR